MSDKPKKVAEEQVVESALVAEEPIAPISINKYNQFELKEHLNDTIVCFMEEKGFREDNQIVDLKIVIGLLASVVIGFNQYYQMQSESNPEMKLDKIYNYHVLSVAGYVLLMGVYYYVEYYMCHDSFYTFYGDKLKGLKGKPIKVQFTSVMDDYDDKFKF